MEGLAEFPDNLLVSTILVAAGIVSSCHALLTKRDARAAFGWIAFCLILPLFGPLVYLIFGINRVKSKAHRLFSVSMKADENRTISDPPGTSFRPLSVVGETVTGRGLSSCDEIEILENGDQLYPAMLDAIRGAGEKIYLSSYLIDNDAIGREFAEALRTAQKRGVDVRVIIDALGEYMSLPRIGRTLSKYGLDFARFNPLTLWPPALHVNMRNHRKILVVDSRLAFSGGQNIGLRHLINTPKVRHPVADLHFRFTGSIVDELEHAFLVDWHYCHTRIAAETFRAAHEIRPQSRIWTRLILDGPNEYLDRLNDTIVGVISAASRRVWIMTPYFLPGSDIVAALVGARLRGVDIKILLPESGNIFMVDWAMRNTFPYYLEKDLGIYLQPAPFTHTKAMIIDEDYSLVGSANLDSRSLRLNFELGMEIFSTRINRQLTDYFIARLSAARKVTPEEINAWSFPKRMRNAMAWLFSPYL